MQLRADQTVAAIAEGERDYRGAPRWWWSDLDAITGPILPGELWVVGARPGNGKTSFLLSWVAHLEQYTETRWLYIGMEMSPEALRRKWAAMRCNLDPDLVLANDWARLPADAKARITADLEDQAAVGRANFAPGRRVDVEALRGWVETAAATGCGVVIVDHFHRMGFKQGNEWFQMAEAVRTAKELAVEHQIALVMAAQLNRGGRDLFDAYLPPPLNALKQCGALEEESDGVLMLFRSLRRGMKRKDMAAVRDGLDELGRWVEPNAMGVVCRKHRRTGAAMDRGVRLAVTWTGLVESWLPDPSDARTTRGDELSDG